ncbi:dTDP-4-dehydrorhamnose reductase [Clostridium saccharoperbutylacetonicum]|nr:sugar nucleotide-binding protein [Clostridium saccharoperbutylacetonicum]NRT63511.1 dTDP-4-dehydrorhamnose reductase [Clostridium saccharoperbutylacetonicum]NSB26874.1 dTDP-4-dehydrorhamnose reductase [Clostridium saccharoperbutylacetonicum]NSB40357.1 dTDP-4-dehydrorhamnose reductase [Clostridium saccharoperbutylacetonicum]
MILISSDYAFSGSSKIPLAEYDLTCPCNAYGKTKLLGENYIREFSSKYFIIVITRS